MSSAEEKCRANRKHDCFIHLGRQHFTDAQARRCGFIEALIAEFTNPRHISKTMLDAPNIHERFHVIDIEWNSRKCAILLVLLSSCASCSRICVTSKTVTCQTQIEASHVTFRLSSAKMFPHFGNLISNAWHNAIGMSGAGYGRGRGAERNEHYHIQQIHVHSTQRTCNFQPT